MSLGKKMDHNKEDIQMIHRFLKGDELAFEEIVIKYRPLMINRIRKYYFPSMDFDDLLQECRIVLFEAIHKFEESKNAYFSSFYIFLLKHRLCELVRFHGASKRQADICLLSELSKDDYVLESYAGQEYSSTLNPCDVIEVRETFHAIYDSLSLKERDAFIRGDIATSNDEVDKQLLYRIRYKLKKGIRSKKCE